MLTTSSKRRQHVRDLTAAVIFGLFFVSSGLAAGAQIQPATGGQKPEMSSGAKGSAKGDGKTPAGPASFMVGPGEVNFKVSQAGQQAAEQVEAYNDSDTPLYVNTTLTDWTLDENGEYKFFPAGSRPESCAKWIQVKPAQFVVEPHKSVSVRINMNFAEAIREERRSMVFFEARLPPNESTRFGVNMVLRIGCNVFARPASMATFTPSPSQPAIQPPGTSAQTGISEQVKVVSMSLQLPKIDANVTGATSNQNRPSPLPSGSLPNPAVVAKPRVVVTVQNTGEQSVRLNGKAHIFDAGGREVASGDLQNPRGRILPGGKRLFWMELANPLPPGRYRCTVEADYGSNSRVVAELETTVPGVRAASGA